MKRRSSQWTIASARQNLPTLVDLAVREPQEIYRRDTLVARVLNPQASQAFVPRGPSAAELLAELQRACAEENYELPIAPRADRANPLVAIGMGARGRRRPKPKSRK